MSKQPWLRNRQDSAATMDPDAQENLVANAQTAPQRTAPHPILEGTELAGRVTSHANHYFLFETVLHESLKFPGELVGRPAARFTFDAKLARVRTAFDEYEQQVPLTVEAARIQVLWVAALIDEANKELAKEPHAMEFERDQLLVDWSAARELLLAALPLLGSLYRSEYLNSEAQSAGSDQSYDAAPSYAVLGNLLEKATALARRDAETVMTVKGRESEVAEVREQSLAATRKAELEFLVTDPLLVDTARAQTILAQFRPRQAGQEGNVLGVI